MNILFVISGLAVGGAENKVADLANAPESRGHDVTLTYMPEPAPLLPESKKVKVVWLGGTKSASGMVSAYISLTKLINSPWQMG